MFGGHGEPGMAAAAVGRQGLRRVGIGGSRWTLQAV